MKKINAATSYITPKFNNSTLKETLIYVFNDPRNSDDGSYESSQVCNSLIEI